MIIHLEVVYGFFELHSFFLCLFTFLFFVLVFVYKCLQEAVYGVVLHDAGNTDIHTLTHTHI